MTTWHQTIIQEFNEGESEYLIIKVYADSIVILNNNDVEITLGKEAIELLIQMWND